MHFRRADVPEQRSIWLFVVPAGHAYNVDQRCVRAGAGLMQDLNTELDESRFAAGVPSASGFSWYRHVDDRYAGYRLLLTPDPDESDAETVGRDLAERVVRGLRRAKLIPDSSDR